MNFKILTVLAIAAIHMIAFTGQAHAMGLLIALTSEDVKIVASEEGITVTPTIDTDSVEVAELSKTEPAAGE